MRNKTATDNNNSTDFLELCLKQKSQFSCYTDTIDQRSNKQIRQNCKDLKIFYTKRIHNSKERQVKDLSKYAKYKGIEVSKVFEEHTSGAKIVQTERNEVCFNCRGAAYLM